MKDCGHKDNSNTFQHLSQNAMPLFDTSQKLSVFNTKDNKKDICHIIESKYGNKL